MLGLRQTTQGSGVSRGDTIIEVLIAITVFSLVVVTALSIMNQGTATSQRSLEISHVRQQIDAQADTLRFLHDSYVAAYYSGIAFDTTDPTTSPAEEYYKILQKVKTATSASELDTIKCNAPPTTRSFVLNTNAARVNTSASIYGTYPKTYAQVVYSGGSISSSQGIWVEGVPSPFIAGDNTGYTDFHIYGCWDSPGLLVPMHLATIVRLYEPRG